MDLRVVITRILAGTVVLGVGVACQCPPMSADFRVTDSEPLRALFGEVAEDRESESCELVCGVLDSEVLGWSCTFAPLVGPTSAECTAPGAAEPQHVEFSEHGLEPLLPITLPANDCEAVCMGTSGWTDAEEAGVEQNAIGCTNYTGETFDTLEMTCTFGYECIGGRRPLGAVPGASERVGGAGAWWAAMAQLEHISIQAFEELARDLSALGAPEDLVQRARAAAEDERRHTRMCRARARASGVEIRVRDAEPAPPADLQSLGRHNAREGCVREAFAALEAGWQSLHAEDPADRAVLARIHDDEVRHGQLAWDIQAWVGDRVDVSVEVEAAFAGLAEDARCGAHAHHTSLGLPTPQVRQGLVAALRAAA